MRDRISSKVHHLRRLFTGREAVARVKLVAGLALLLTIGVLLHQAEAGPPAQEPALPAAAAPVRPPRLEPLLNLGHGNQVVAVAFSPDGKVIASGGGFRDGSIQLWDAATGRPMHRLGGHEAGVSSIAFAPDGKTLASAGWAAELILWDVATGKEAGRIPAPEVGITCLAFAPDGKVLASATLENTVHLWDVAQRKEIGRLEGQEKTNKGEIPVLCAFAPDGALLAMVNRGRNSEVCVWEVATGKERHRFKSGYEITSAVFAPDGKTLACEEYDIPGRDSQRHETIGLWDLATGRKVAWFAPARSTDKNYVIASRLTFAPDGKMLASANSDGSFSLWELATGRERYRDQGPVGPATCLAFAPDGKTLATGSAAGAVQVWDVGSLYPKRRAVSARLKADDVAARWRDLVGDDAARAHTAMMELAAAAGDSAPFLAEQMRPQAFDLRKVERLIRDLDSDQFDTRQHATAELEKLGELAVGPLRRALADKLTLEVSRRVETLLEKLERPISGERLRRLRTVEVLERMATPAARQVLARLADGPAGLRETDEARSARQRLEGRP